MDKTINTTKQMALISRLNILLNRILHNRQELHEGKRLSRNKENSYLLIGLEFISS